MVYAIILTFWKNRLVNFERKREFFTIWEKVVGLVLGNVQTIITHPKISQIKNDKNESFWKFLVDAFACKNILKFQNFWKFFPKTYSSKFFFGNFFFRNFFVWKFFSKKFSKKMEPYKLLSSTSLILHPLSFMTVRTDGQTN